MNTNYDLIVVGGGPSGLTAAMYGLRAGLKVVIIEKQNIGGQTLTIPDIKNYPGFISISGVELTIKMHEQVISLGAVIVYDDIKSLDLIGDTKRVETFSNGTFTSQTIVLAMGAIARNLGLPREQEFIGAGISYCAVCDGTFFKDLVVAVVGGGNTAIDDAIYLAGFAKKVYIIHRQNRFKADEELISTLNTFNKIEKIMDCKIVELLGENKLSGIKIENLNTGNQKQLDINGLFIAVGRGPDTELVKNIVTLNKNGYILTNDKMETNISGIYVAGDVRESVIKQIVIACADGAVAATMANRYIKSKKYKKV
ncbi:MAG: thioredoxin-disulfide reductase [Clostridia bacterium]|jgi:thioredoxin reductase (NADPH)|nr:thioredoxin-disulfide reductase [Clostridia bacterium]MDD4275593.1 thioredoxin-disulfide reductase [Clostridia bacterium]